MAETTSRTPGASDFADLAGVYLDRPALILCGGPSLPEQAERAGEADWLRISVNEHGCKLTECDYIVALDNIPNKIINFGVPIIGFYSWAAYRLLNFWNAGQSGMQAVWCAHSMGCNPIVLAGADCYTSGTYWWDRQAESSGNNIPLDNQIQGWEQLKRRCPMAAIRSVGGPLAGVFGEYSPGAACDRPQPFKLEDHDWGSIVRPGVLVKIKNACALRGEHYDAGRIARISRDDAHTLTKLGKAEYTEESDEHRNGRGQAGAAGDVRSDSKRSRAKRKRAAG